MASIWASMNYTPPRGACNHKVSTSFECDGCGHHASFHSMENKNEDEIVKRWQVEDKEIEEALNTSGNARKRPRKVTEESTTNIRPRRAIGKADHQEQGLSGTLGARSGGYIGTLAPGSLLQTVTWGTIGGFVQEMSDTGAGDEMQVVKVRRARKK